MMDNGLPPIYLHLGHNFRNKDLYKYSTCLWIGFTSNNLTPDPSPDPNLALTLTLAPNPYPDPSPDPHPSPDTNPNMKQFWVRM